MNARESLREEKARRMREWRRRNPERAKQIKQDYIDRNKESYSKKQRSTQLKRRYGITIDDYEKALLKQSGCCKICGKLGGDDRASRLVVDHCHSTGVVRDLVCQPCNAVIGMSFEDVAVLQSAINYLVRWKQ